jgi:hypothetical protein
MNWTYIDRTLSFMKNSCDFLLYIFHVIHNLWSCSFNIWKHVDEFKFFCVISSIWTNLEQFKNIVVIKCLIKISSFSFSCYWGSIIRWECSTWILGFLRTLVREIQVNGLYKISLTWTFVLFSIIFVSTK